MFEAILDYGQHGVVPDLDGVLGIAWDFIQPLIDADGEAYQAKCEQARRAIEARWAKGKADTDVYAGIRTDTEDTNNNNNSKSNSISRTMIEGAVAATPRRMADVAALSEMDFEDQRRARLELLEGLGS